MRRSILLAALLLAMTGAARAAPPARETVRVDVLYTSDIHGHIDRSQATFLSPEFPPPLGGGASAATYVARVRAEAAADTAGGRPPRRVLLFDSGDLFQGTPLGAHTQGAAIIEWMNRMGYDAATLGNHDFDLGRENTERLAGIARFPVLAGNLFDSTSGARVPWVRGHVMLEVEGIRIALLGYITESTVGMSFAKHIAGLEFRRVIDVLPGDVRRMRADGADLVFVLLHHGMPYRLEVETEYRDMIERAARGGLVHAGMNAMELAHAVAGVDAFFSGHTHQGFDRPWEDPRTHAVVFEPYGNGSSLGHVTIEVDRGTRTMIGYTTHFDRGALLTLLEDEVWPDSGEARILGAQVAEAEQGLEAEVGRAIAAIQSGSAENGLLGFLMADAFREELDADVALQNTGGVRGVIPAGTVTERDLLGVAPFGNQMVLAQLTGGMLRALIEDKLAGSGGGIFISGGRVRYDLGRPDGARVVEFTVGGAPLDTSRVYRVALTNYLAEGNSGMGRLRVLPPETFLPSGFTDRELLGRYIRRVGVLSPVNDGRWQRVRGS
jgi:2',3'-cyclic-nucleotide 2'-phosphodiesterase (5'-nucleotidase family)